MVSYDSSKWFSFGKDNSKDTLGFAVSIIGIFFIILYTGIPKIFENSLDSATSIALYVFMIFSYVIILLLGLYIFIVGFSLNPRIDNTAKENLLKTAPYFYEAAFFIILMALVFPCYIYIIMSFFGESLFFVILWGVLAYTTVYLIAIRILKITTDYYAASILVCTAILLLIIIVNSNFDIVDMDISINNINELDSKPIPISVKTMGQKGNLTVYLYKEKDFLMPQIDYLKLNIEQRDLKNSEYMYGMYLDEGIYNIYINTTNMSSGFYAIKFNVRHHEERVTFQLLDTHTDMYNINLSMNENKNETIQNV